MGFRQDFPSLELVSHDVRKGAGLPSATPLAR